MSLDIYGIALVYTSATLAAATTNCLPVITFFLALLLRIESLRVKSMGGIAKLVGIVACLGGAAILAFYKGPHFQGFVMKGYPSKLLLTTLQCLLSSIQSFGIALAVERDMQQWKLGWNGIMVTGVTFYLQAWVIEKKGPVFLAMSTPLALIITIFSSAILLGEIITLGSLLGGLILVIGLYSVLWGKSREQLPKPSFDSSDQASPV
ncbi:WAT1-related protein [Senna tora]|uniref:WAT1-related protein n=1 Tax=Senna tora TaxID=362788 RepID=A0A834WXE7_9FABA|nr:WAT1-related protein [Senna tora]